MLKDLCGHPIGSKHGQDMRTSFLPKASTKRFVSEEFHETRGEALTVAAGHDISGFSITDDFRGTPRISGDNRHPERLSLQQHIRQALGPGR